MRISTSALYNANVASLNQQQGRLLQTQQQLASGRRIMTPADDPAAAALVLDMSQSDSANTQHASNIGQAQSSLSLSEGTLQSVTSLLQDLQTVVVSAGNTATMSNGDRQMLVADLQGRLDSLIGLANSTDGTGNYIFSGFKGNTTPFVNTAGGGVQYMGDDGQRMIQVSTVGQVAGSDSGADVFMRIKNGNGTFVTQPAVGNTGSGIASQGMVISSAALTGHSYQVTFTSATTYNVYDTTTDPMMLAPLPSSGPYVSGQAISFDGMQFDIKGVPANGDQFTVAPSTNESIFKTMSDLINALNTPIIPGSVASPTQLSFSVGKALNGLNRSLDNILMVRASLGSRLNQLDSEKSTGDSYGIQYKQTISQLQDVDYNRAISDLTQQQTMLQAAQKSFKLVSDLSMFNYM